MDIGLPILYKQLLEEVFKSIQRLIMILSPTYNFCENLDLMIIIKGQKLNGKIYNY